MFNQVDDVVGIIQWNAVDEAQAPKRKLKELAKWNLILPFYERNSLTTFNSEISIYSTFNLSKFLNSIRLIRGRIRPGGNRGSGAALFGLTKARCPR